MKALRTGHTLTNTTGYLMDADLSERTGHACHSTRVWMNFGCDRRQTVQICAFFSSRIRMTEDGYRLALKVITRNHTRSSSVASPSLVSWLSSMTAVAPRRFEAMANRYRICPVSPKHNDWNLILYYTLRVLFFRCKQSDPSLFHLFLLPSSLLTLAILGKKHGPTHSF